MSAVIENIKNSLPPALSERLDNVLSLGSQALWHEFTEEVSTMFITVLDSKDPKTIALLEPLFKELVSPLLNNVSLMVWVKLGLIAGNSTAFLRTEIIDQLNQLSTGTITTRKTTSSLSIPSELAIRIAKLHLALHLFSEGDPTAMDAWNILRYEEFNPNLIKDTDEASLLIEAQSALLLRINWSLKEESYDVLYTLSMEYLKTFAKIRDLDHISALDRKILLSLSDMEPMIDNLCKGALLSENCFNFGPLLALPIWSFQSEKSPMHSLLSSMYDGDECSFLEFFSSTSATAANVDASFLAQTNSTEPSSAIRQKFCLMKLSASISRHLSEDNSGEITFAQVGQFASIPEEEVEFLLIRSLSLGIIKGSIVEQDSVFRVSWVEPRILCSKADIKSLIIGLKDWRMKVKLGIERISSKIYSETYDDNINTNGLSMMQDGGKIIDGVCGMVGAIMCDE